jgi:hypothetical protein
VSLLEVAVVRPVAVAVVLAVFAPVQVWPLYQELLTQLL